MNSPAYYRARIKSIEFLLGQENAAIKGENAAELKRREKRIALLRNGVFPAEYKESEWVAKQMAKAEFDSSPLSFFELTRCNTWFSMHPEKIAGKEVESSSREFPISIAGDKETVIKTIRNSMKGNNTEDVRVAGIREKVRLMKAKLLEQHLEGLYGLDGLAGLGELVRSEISNNLPALRQVIEKTADEKKYKATDKLSFEEVMRSYNAGITEDEIKAWVWYKRSVGIPMTGWEKYFLANENEGQEGEVLITIRKTVIRDNHFREINVVPAEVVLGKPTRFSNEYDGTVYIVFTASNGDKQYVSDKDIKRVKNGVRTSIKQLHTLVRKKVLYYSEGELLPYPVYAYGNMYDRELQLEKDKDYIMEHFGEDIYAYHKEIISQAKPQLLSIAHPDERMRPKILVISSFADEFRIRALKEDTGIELEEKEEGHSLVDAFRPYLLSLSHTDFRMSSASDIWNHYIRGMKMTDKDLNPEQREEKKVNARNEGEELFSRFLYEALLFEDQEKINYHWNRTYNGQSNIAYHRIPIGFECSAKFKQFNLQFSPAQREGVAFMEAVGSGIIAYDVGVGKTMTAIIALANAMYCGKASRPLIVVPNPTYAKWVKEIIGYEDEKTGEFIPGVLSNTGIKLNEWYNLGTEAASSIRLDRKIAPNTITLVTYEGFKKIGFSEKVMKDFLVELTNILYQSKGNESERDKEIDYQKYREKIGMGLKDTIADIDTLGIDYIVLDEAHRCKNIFEGVKADENGKKRFGISGAVSELGIKAFFLTNFIQRTYGRDVMLLTATPFTNSPLEIYSMLSLVAYDSMKKLGIYNLSTFFELFVLEKSEYVVNYKEEVVLRDVVKSFNNRLLLQKLIYNHINYKTGEEAGVKRPCKVNLPRINVVEDGKVIRLKPDKQTLTYLNMTDRQRRNQVEITESARDASRYKFNMAEMFRAMSHSLDNALSPFLYDETPEDYKEFVEESPKIFYIMKCIASVKQWHEQRGESVSGQLIYMNRGKDFFHYIKEYLELEIGFKKGVKWNNVKLDEVEIITSEMGQAKKENVKEGFLAGVVKVIIGTSTIREGIDLQRKGTVIYNAYPDWNPTDIRQLEGRIWRQGNEFGYVRVVMPLVQDSMDVFIFQKLEEKTARINDIWYRGDRGNVLDLESLDPLEVKLALMSDVEQIADMKLKQLKAEVGRNLQIIEMNLATLTGFDRLLLIHKSRREACLTTLKRALQLIPTINYNAYPYNIMNQMALAKLKEYRKVLLNDIAHFFESSTQEDRELLRLCRRLGEDKELPSNLNDQRLFGDFWQSLSEVRKAEKNILGKKGFTIKDNLSEIISAYRADKARIEAELKKLSSPEYKEELVEEAQIKKSAMAVDGASPEIRAREFAKLNYLLSYRSSDVDDNACILPMEEKKKSQAFEDEAFRMRMKWKVLQMKLKLLKVA